MRISEKVKLTKSQLAKHGPITIAAFGDSVTHGFLATGEIDHETVYHNLLKKRILENYSYVPVTVINAGIGGESAHEAVERLDSTVLRFDPDLVIVCFGLNDVNGELDVYLGALRKIFEKCNINGCETVFMTPNMLNTYVADDTAKIYFEYAHKTMEMQNGGRMDLFINSAKALAEEMNIPVCDCYAKWKELAKTTDTTLLLSNRINHPTREMHALFADSLYEMIFKDIEKDTDTTDKSMYSGASK